MIINQLLGDGWTETDTTISFLKADLNLSPGARSAESILVAIIKRSLFLANNAITTELGSPLTDELGESIELFEEQLDLYLQMGKSTLIWQRGKLSQTFNLTLVDQVDAENQ